MKTMVMMLMNQSPDERMSKIKKEEEDTADIF